MASIMEGNRIMNRVRPRHRSSKGTDSFDFLLHITLAFKHSTLFRKSARGDGLKN